jgi:hypothetical protein
MQEANEGSALRGPRPPPDDNDDPVMGLSFRQREEVIAIAGHEQAVSLERALKHQRVSGLRTEHVANASNLVAELAKQVGQILRNILVEEERHDRSGAAAICRATSRSISPR